MGVTGHVPLLGTEAVPLFDSDSVEHVVNRTEARVLIQSAARTLRGALSTVGSSAGLEHKAEMMCVEMCNQLIDGVNALGISAEQYDR